MPAPVGGEVVETGGGELLPTSEGVGGVFGTFPIGIEEVEEAVDVEGLSVGVLGVLEAVVLCEPGSTGASELFWSA